MPDGVMSRVLFIMPTFSAPSELWMGRMLSALEGSLLAVACYEAPVREHLGVPVVDLGSRKDPASILAGERAIMGLLRENPRSPVLGHYLPFVLRYESVWADVGNPLFVHAHGYDLTPDLLRTDAEGRMVRFHPSEYSAEVVRLSRRAMILANSQGSARKLEAMGVHPSRVVVKYLGVPVPAEWPQRRIEAGGLNCLFLGRLVDFKGPLESLRAFEIAAGGGMRGQLTFAGDGPLAGELRAAVERSAVRERVRLLGAVTAEVGEGLRAGHDVFLSHSQVGPTSGQEEALGVAYLEALAAGMPVVSAWGGSLAEVVRDGETGLLTQPGDVDALAGSLVRLSGDPATYERLSRGGYADARSRFSDAAERRALHSILSSVR